jgi:FixJ family two-component response regulator
MVPADTAAVTTRSLAHVAVADDTTRVRIADALQRHGFTVVEHPSGFHLLAGISGVIDDSTCRGAADDVSLPSLLVVDAIARGCSGATIAAGLRELGTRIPLVLITRPGEPVPASDDALVRIVSADGAVRAVHELARTAPTTCQPRDGACRR